MENTRWNYVIATLHNDKALFWNNDDGWTSFEECTIFDHIDRLHLNLPIGGEWLQYNMVIVLMEGNK